MRVTENLKYANVLRNLSGLASQQADASKKALSGSAIANPSDDPVAAAELVRNRAALSRIESHRSTIRTVLGDTELAEGTLAQASDLFASAKELALQGANGSLGPDERGALAESVRHLREQLAQLANTSGARGYLFAGSQTSVRPFDASGTFFGDGEDAQVDLGGSSPVTVDLAGAEAFTVAGGRDVFGDLTALENALNANDATAVAATLDDLDTSRRQVVDARAKVGLMAERLRTSDSIFEDGSVRLNEHEQRVAQADPIEAYSRMMSLNSALEQAITVSRQILDTGNNRF